MPTAYTVTTHDTGCKIITGERGIPLVELNALLHAWTKDRPQWETSAQITADPILLDAEASHALSACAVVGRQSQLLQLRRQINIPHAISSIKSHPDQAACAAGG